MEAGGFVMSDQSIDKTARALVLIAAFALLSATPAPARMGPGVATVRPIRIEGYWERPRSEHDVLDEITIAADGGARRQFGVTALQAYKPEEEGAQVLRHSTLQPVTLTLQGRKEMIERFMHAGRDDKIVALGAYRAGSARLVLSSVEVHHAAPPGAEPSPSDHH